MEPFVVKHYSADERPTLKGNGFDGLEIGEDREEAERFVAFVNAAVAAERERCAKVCEWVASDLENAEEDAQAMSIGAQSCADQIRAGA
jgi:hypothetical protein